jgi:hypothetical protein
MSKRKEDVYIVNDDVSDGDEMKQITNKLFVEIEIIVMTFLLRRRLMLIRIYYALG